MKKDRLVYLDILNVIAIVAVIALHHSGGVHVFSNTITWLGCLIVECLCYFAVPLFCMISGANLMNYRKKYDTKTFFKKRFLKVLFPFLIWTIIMFIWKIKILNEMEPFNTIVSFFNAFFENKEETTYYFMFCILGIYLTMPLLSLLADKKNHKTLWFVVCLYFIFNGFIPNVLILYGINYNQDFSVLLGGFTCFIILGYLLSTTNLLKKYKYLIYSGALVGLIYRFATTYYFSVKYGYVFKGTWGYTSWHSILLTSSVYLIIKDLFYYKYNLNKKISNVFCVLSSCSFGIYLIHKIIMFYLLSIFNIHPLSIYWRTFGVILTYCISLCFVYILKKIPILKKIVP